jgi:hypothetical protein
MTRICLLILALVACRRAAEPGRPEARITPPALAPVTTTATVLPIINLDRGVRIFDSQGDTQRAATGSLRAEVTRDGVTLARDRFADEIIGAVPVRDGWLFVARDGAVARAASFTGELTALGQLPRRHERLPVLGVVTPSCGRLALATTDPRASLWTTDGSSSLAPAAGAPVGIVVSAAFADADHGMIIVDGGELFHTRDAGRSFQRVDIGTEAAAEVSCRDGKLRVEASSAILAFDRDGKPIKAPDAPPWWGTDELRARIHAAALRREPALAERFGGVIASDGRALIPVGEALREVATASDADLMQVVSRQRSCSAARWGRGFALVCKTGVFRVDGKTLRATAVWRPPGQNEDAPRPRHGQRTSPPQLDLQSATFSSDGVHAVSGCNFSWAGQYRRFDSVCVLTPDGKIAERARGTDTLVGMRGDAYFMLRHSPKLTVVEIEAATGDERRSIEIAMPPKAPAIVWDQFMVSADGIFSGTAYAASASSALPVEVHLLRVDVGNGSVTAVRLPDGATRGVFVDADRAIAVGRDLSRSWVTDDGGASWQVLATDVSGAIAARPASHTPDWLPEWHIACAGKRCTIDGRIAVTFDATPVTTRERVLASLAPITEPPPYKSTPRRFSCSQHGTARTAPLLENVEDYQLDGKGRSRYQKASVDLRLAVSANHWSLEWNGRDALGVYGKRTSSGRIAGARRDYDSYQLLRATREGIVMHHLAGENRIVWAPAGGHPVQISDPSLEFGNVADLLALADGRLAIAVNQWDPQVYEHSARYTRLIVVDRNGRVVARRTFYRDAEQGDPGIAYVDNAIGIQWIEDDPDLPRWLHPVAAEPKRELPPLDLKATPICTGAIDPHASTFVLHEPLERAPQEIYANDVWRVYINERARCLQAIELVLGRTNLDAHDVFAVAKRGELQVDYYRGNVFRSSWLDIRCKAD